jgi:hypothetical protein
MILTLAVEDGNPSRLKGSKQYVPFILFSVEKGPFLV